MFESTSRGTVRLEIRDCVLELPRRKLCGQISNRCSASEQLINKSKHSVHLNST